MLPHAYELPAVILLMLGGALACLAGYRLLRIVLGIYGFVAGAMLVSSMMGSSDSIWMVAAALAGGIVGALILMFAYFVGIALVGAGLGALLAHVIWNQRATTDPPVALIIALSIVGVVGAMLLQRYVIIVGTAFGGAWTIIVGALAITGERDVARAAAKSEAWILYPLSPAAGQRWVPIAWIVLGLIGTAVQLSLTGRKR